MDIKKALSYVAFGFLFTLINLNLTIGSLTINVTPDFIGWILFFLAFDKFGSYLEGKSYLKWISLCVAIVSAATWLLDLVMPEVDPGYLNTVVSTVSVIYTFILFGTLVEIAEECGSATAKTLNFLKYINVVLHVAFVVVGLTAASDTSNTVLLGAAAIIGALALVAAIFTCVTLFRLRKDYNEKVPE